MKAAIWYTPKDIPTTRLLTLEGSEADKLAIKLALVMCDSKQYHSVHFDDMKGTTKEIFGNEGMGVK